MKGLQVTIKKPKYILYKEERMLAEQLIFTVISLAFFVYTFLKMIRKNDTSYVIILILEAIGIALNFI